jgi:uncharacterized protein (DUF2267 family)
MVARQTLVSKVSEEGGLAWNDAELALAATLATVSEELAGPERALLEEAVPGVREASHVPGTFYERVRVREATTPGFAREHAQVVLRALGELVGPDLRDRLASALPTEIAEHLGPRPIEGLPPSHDHHHPTLAEGHPGSDHPISTSGKPR